MIGEKVSLRPGEMTGIDSGQPRRPLPRVVTWSNFAPSPTVHVTVPHYMARRFRMSAPSVSGSTEIEWGTPLTDPSDLPMIWDRLRHVRDAYFAPRAGNPQSVPPGLYETELEVINKTVVESGYPPFWALMPHGTIRDDRPPLPMISIVAEEANEWANEVELTPTDLAAVTSTANGAPTEDKGPFSFAVHDALAGCVAMMPFNEGLELFEEVCRSLRVAPWRVIRVISRTGPIAKWMPVFAMENEVTARSEEYQEYCRRRHVLLVMAWLNQLHRPAATRVKKGFQKRVIWPARADDVAMDALVFQAHRTVSYWRKRGYQLSIDDLEWIEADLSGFDQSVRYSDKMEIAEKLWAPQFAKDGIVPGTAYYEMVQTMPLLIHRLRPSWSAALVGTRGMTKSGEIGTTDDGIVIGTSIGATAYAIMAMVEERAAWKEIKDGACVLANWGDDLLMGVPPWIAKRADTVAPVLRDEYYYKLDMKRGSMWLFKERRVTEDPRLRKTYRSAARVAGRWSVGKEYLPSDADVEAVGDYESLRMLVGHPLYSEIERELFPMKAGYRRLGISNLQDLLAYVSSASFRDRMARRGSAHGELFEIVRGLMRGDPSLIAAFSAPWMSGALKNRLMKTNLKLPDQRPSTLKERLKHLNAAIAEYRRRGKAFQRPERRLRDIDSEVTRLLGDARSEWACRQTLTGSVNDPVGEYDWGKFGIDLPENGSVRSETMTQWAIEQVKEGLLDPKDEPILRRVGVNPTLFAS